MTADGFLVWFHNPESFQNKVFPWKESVWILEYHPFPKMTCTGILRFEPSYSALTEIVFTETKSALSKKMGNPLTSQSNWHNPAQLQEPSPFMLTAAVMSESQAIPKVNVISDSAGAPEISHYTLNLRPLSIQQHGHKTGLTHKAVVI